MASPKPRVDRSDIGRLKSLFQKPALTSFFQCWFLPNGQTQNWINARGLKVSDRLEEISLLCHEASLPGNSLATNEIVNDFHGVTERHAYRKQFDDRADFTFYVDHYGTDNDGDSHNIIWFFENWIDYVVHESLDFEVGDRPTTDKTNYFYRSSFPEDYQATIYVNKFERDYRGTFLEYEFLQAYPFAITSMPVSYDTSQLLKCTVSFQFTRYVKRRKSYNIGKDGISNPSRKFFNYIPNLVEFPDS